mgnify:CR=1 FL=1
MSDQQPPRPDPNHNHPNQRPGNESGDERKLPRPPLHTFIFWIVILFALPILIVFLGRQDDEDVTPLTQSDFENYLQDGRILSATIVRDPSTGVKAIRGEYRPKTTADEQDVQPPPELYHVKVTYTEKLDELLRDAPNNPERMTEITSNVWSNILISVLPILLLVGLIYFLFSRQLRAAGRGALQFGKSRARLMTPSQERITFADVAGVDEAKEEVQEVVDFLKDPQKFQHIGGRIPKGVLMIGPPGTGKTLLARAIAGEAGVPFFSISGSDFIEMFVGVGASRVRDMFEEGKRNAPCLVFIDEIDAVGRSRFSGIGGGHDEREQTLNALLSEMDGFEPNTGIIILAATNRPDVLDPALMRPGRFDRRITVDMPDLGGRLEILQIHSKAVKVADNVDLNIIAKGTPGFSGADLANLINEAALTAARHSKKEIDLADLEEARDKVRWGKERRSRTIDEHDRHVTAYHEAGHTLVTLLCEHSIPLHKVTIIPRGTSFLGATLSLPERDRYTQSKREMDDHLAILMAGRIAEEMMFDDITSGAAMDLRQASDLARKMVCEWGMSENLGPLTFGHREEHIYLGRDITRSQDYSEDTATKIDNEVRTIVSKAESRARNILTAHKDKLELLGVTLLEKETLSADDIRVLLGFEKPQKDGEDSGDPAPDTGDKEKAAEEDAAEREASPADKSAADEDNQTGDGSHEQEEQESGTGPQEQPPSDRGTP